LFTFFSHFLCFDCKKNSNTTASFQDNLLSRYQEVKPSWISLHQEMIEMAVVTTSLNERNSSHIATTNMPSLGLFTGWMPFVSPNQPCQITEGILLFFYNFIFCY